jgi:Mn-dependent DtxR family transcriptional regulator
MRKEAKKIKLIERFLKGGANHYRIEILLLMEVRPNITLETITEFLHANIKTISEHTRRLHQAGLVNKKYKGRSVEHSLTPMGQKICNFIKTF